MFKEHSNLILSDEERTKLKAEFDKLKTIDQKYDFWKDRFDFDYSRHYELEELSIKDFKIMPRNSAETEKINNRLHKNYVLRYGDGNNESPDVKKEKFIDAIDSAKNKEILIEYELKNIDDHIARLKHPTVGNKHLGIYTPYYKGELFFIGYEQYLMDGKEFDWSEKLYPPISIIEISLGVKWAQYREFVKYYLAPKKTEKKKAFSFSHDQQIFILDYLCVYKNLDNVKKGKLYGPLINRDSETTRQRLSSIETRKTIENLNPILSYFTELGLEDQMQLVQKDIDRKEQERKGKMSKK